MREDIRGLISDVSAYSTIVIFTLICILAVKLLRPIFVTYLDVHLQRQSSQNTCPHGDITGRLDAKT